jgi:hypothetical protein
MKDELSNELTPSKTNDKNPTKKKWNVKIINLDLNLCLVLF